MDRTSLILVGAGYDGANVWEVGTGRKMAVPFRTNSVPAISASAWLRFEDLDTDVLVLGTACAHLFFYSIKKGSSVSVLLIFLLRLSLTMLVEG